MVGGSHEDAIPVDRSNRIGVRAEAFEFIQPHHIEKAVVRQLPQKR